MNKKRELLHRVLINGGFGLLLVFLIAFAQQGPFRYLFVAAVAIIQAIALWEFYQLVRRKGMAPAAKIGIGASLLYVVGSFLKTQGPSFLAPLWYQFPEIVLGLTFFASFVFFAFWGEEPLLNIATTFLGVVYVAIPLGLIVRIVYFFSYRGEPDPFHEGCWWLAYLIAVTKSADMGAFFVGRSLGKRKLALRLSPKKTLEGAIGGLLLAMATSLIVFGAGRLSSNLFLHLTWWGALLLGFVVALFGQMGDLAESLLKRDAEVKDSNVLPGVGGILDMVDSLLFTAPIIFIFLKVQNHL